MDTHSLNSPYATEGLVFCKNQIPATYVEKLKKSRSESVV